MDQIKIKKVLLFETVASTGSLFAAEGMGEDGALCIWVFNNYEAAVKKAQGLIHLSYSCVSAYRLASGD